jgi:hypothetical protein
MLLRMGKLMLNKLKVLLKVEKNVRLSVRKKRVLLRRESLEL